MSKLLQLIHKAWAINRPLTSLVILCAFSILVCSTGLAVDHRLINGELGWIKPCKFSISFFVYGISMIWFSTFLKRHAHVFRIASTAAFIGAAVELAAIILQVVRGTTSHFNTGTIFDHVIFIVVKAAIIPVALAVLVSFILLLRQKDLPQVLDSALHWGVFLTMVGCVPAVLMVMPDPLQDAITNYRQFHGHTIGFTEGGPGLPWLGWSTVAGDLRIAHFVGIHALQVLPILGLWIITYLPRLSVPRQKALVWNAGFSYLSVILTLTWQALQAESITSPSEMTLCISGAIAAASAIVAIITFVYPERVRLSEEQNLHPAKTHAANAGSANLSPANLGARQYRYVHGHRTEVATTASQYD
jgi:hypothetical protein